MWHEILFSFFPNHLQCENICGLYKNSTDKPICRNRDADIESGCLDIGLMAGGMNWKIKTDINTL